MIKLFGALLILISGSSIGWIYGSIYLNRIRELEELQLAISILDTEISYGRTLLPGAIRTALDVLGPPLNCIFSDAADRLEKSREYNFNELWQEILEEYRNKCYLSDDDYEILANWGRQIGTSTLDDQNRINQLTIKRLEQNESIAREIARRKVKPVRYAGVLISLMVIILFY
ncbi:MAG: hypothetical protein ACLFPF_06840 [Halanaerobiales bacterium]